MFLIYFSQCELPCREVEYVNFQCEDRSNEQRHRDRDCCQPILDDDGNIAQYLPVNRTSCSAYMLHETGQCEQDFCCHYSEWSDWDVCATADGEVLE